MHNDLYFPTDTTAKTLRKVEKVWIHYKQLHAIFNLKASQVHSLLYKKQKTNQIAKDCWYITLLLLDEREYNASLNL